jgi:hypothetical protein
MTTPARFFWHALFRGFAFALACALTLGALAADSGDELRVESEVFTDGSPEPVARSLTLFRDGLAWDFLDRPAPRDRASDAEPATEEIVLHDPARERVVIVDPRRNVKTQIESLRLERLSVSLASWARKADDRLVRWAGGPDFGEGIHEADERLELIGPRVRYAVEFTEAPSADTADVYRRFADTAMLLKALLHPGGIPPFPRLAINRRISAASVRCTRCIPNCSAATSSGSSRPRPTSPSPNRSTSPPTWRRSRRLPLPRRNDAAHGPS